MHTDFYAFTSCTVCKNKMISRSIELTVLVAQSTRKTSNTTVSKIRTHSILVK